MKCHECGCTEFHFAQGPSYIVDKSHKDENGVTIIDEFRLTGVSVVGHECCQCKTLYDPSKDKGDLID